MTKATRDALNAVSRILQEAGWDQPENEGTDPVVEALIFDSLQNHYVSLEELAARLHLPADRLSEAYRSAVMKLSASHSS